MKRISESLRLLVKSIAYIAGICKRAEKFKILVFGILSLTAAALPIANLYSLNQILNILVNGSDTAPYAWFLLFLITLILTIYVEKTLQFHKSMIQSKIRISYELSIERKLSDMPLIFLDSSSGRDKIEEVDYTKQYICDFPFHIMSLVKEIYLFLTVFITLLRFYTGITILYVLLMIPGVLINLCFNRKNQEFRLKHAPDARKFSYYRWMLTDSWPSKDIRMYGLTSSIMKRYEEEKSLYVCNKKKLDKKHLKASLFVGVLKQCGEAVFLIFIISLAAAGRLSAGDVILYAGLAEMLAASFEESLYSSIDLFIVFLPRMANVLQFFNSSCEKTERKQKLPLDRFERLEFRDVYFRYPQSDRDILKGASFVIERGEKVSIIGINGAGKSTIVKLMLGLYEIGSGQILINDRPMEDYDITHVRKLFSVLFQNYVRYSLTLRENATLSDIMEQKNDSKIVESMKKSSIYEEYDKFQYNLDIPLTRLFSDDGAELSGGQWQKIALTRTYFKDAPVIVFDEPSASLDAESEDRIFKNFNQISQNNTGIMISHRISGARYSSKILVLENGRIAENGSHNELIKRNGLYAGLLNLQRDKYIKGGKGYAGEEELR